MLTLTGAAAVFDGPVNYAFAYGLTKSATHALVLQMAERNDLPKKSNVNCILPYLLDFYLFRTMIDTEVNRKGMPNEDHSKWLPPQ